MTDDLFDRLSKVTAIDEDSGMTEDGSVEFDILSRNAVGVSVGETLITISAEPGEDDDGRDGWILYGPNTELDPKVRVEAMRVAKLALESFGYLVWDGDAS